MLFTFSALISNIYWCGIVSHQQILMVRHVAPAEIIGAVNATPAASVPTPMHTLCMRAAEALASLAICTDSPEHLLLANVISTEIFFETKNTC